MTAQRRLARLEAALSPKATVLLWLTEAQQFPSLPAYVRWLIDQPASIAPLVSIPDTVERALRSAKRGQPRPLVEAAVLGAVRDAVFLVELVIVINLVADRAISHVSVRHPIAKIGPQLSAGDPRGGGAPHDAISLVALEDLARLKLERRHFDGHTTLFGDSDAIWRDERHRLDQLRWRGGDLPQLRSNGSRRRSRGATSRVVDMGALTEAASARAEGLADSARANALTLLGDANAAAATARRRLTGVRYGSGVASDR